MGGEKASSKWLLCVVGPTAVGKTDVAVALAKHFNTEIIAADSRQIFRDLSVGTNKPTEAERLAAPHAMVDVRNPEETFTVADYEREALACLAQIFEKQDMAICAAGTGFYLQALEVGVGETPPAAPDVRAAVAADMERYGLAKLLDELAATDPECYAEIDQLNPRRVARAVEVIRQTGRPFSSFKAKPVRRPFRILKVGLDRPRAELHRRIEDRTHQMFNEGLIAEVAALLNSGLQPDAQSLQSIGYREVVCFLKGDYTLAECQAAVIRNTKDYARRQLTWFRKDSSTHWEHPENRDKIIAYFEAQTHPPAR
jgi:tRNA dimethylallyltransferase